VKRLLFRQALLLSMTVVLVVVVAGGLFLLARSHYLPSTAPFWNVPGPSGGVFFFSSAPQDLASRANLPVLLLILEAAMNSAFLVFFATGSAVALGVPFGYWLAIHAPRQVSDILRTLTNLGVGLPAFFLAFLLQVAAVELSRVAGRPLVPTIGFGLDGHLVIPVLSLALAPLALIARLVTLGATDLNAKDFARTARAKGLSETRVVYGHLLPNMVGTLSEAILGGARLVIAGLVVVEYLVAWPGLGFLLLRAIKVQDGLVLLCSVALLGSLFLLLDRGVDLVTGRTGRVTA